MRSESFENSGVVWVVSFGFTEAGEPHDYQIKEIDLTDKPAKTVKLLKDKLGDGVFISHEAAEQWILAQTSKNKGCCQADKAADSNSCCCSQGEVYKNKDSDI